MFLQIYVCIFKQHITKGFNFKKVQQTIFCGIMFSDFQSQQMKHLKVLINCNFFLEKEKENALNGNIFIWKKCKQTIIENYIFLKPTPN